MAVGSACGIVAGSASALELGELNVHSALGQPLRASIAYALNPHEELYAFCVALQPGVAANGLPAITKANISVADGIILLAGPVAIREPMLTMQVAIDCPYTAHLIREYTLMLNPPQATDEAAVPVSGTVRQRQGQRDTAPASTPARPEPRAVRQPAPDRSPIAENSRYLVQRGDTVSEIASRISNRAIPLWPAVDRIFAANPDAFIDNDVNRLKAGSWLVIPDLAAPAGKAAPAASAAVSASTDTAAPVATTEGQAYGGYASTGELEAAATAEEPSLAVPGESAASDGRASDFAGLRPGDVVVGDQNPFVSVDETADLGAGSETIIADTVIVQPNPTSSVTEVQMAAPSNDAEAGRSWSSLFWLGGTGVALILGLLLFGQNLRRRFGSVAIAAPSAPRPNRRWTDPDTPDARALADVDFHLRNAPHPSSITLDADFDDGTGLQDSADIDVAQDFGFSASATFDDELDMVLPEESQVGDGASGTDVIPPPPRDLSQTIVESEILPSDEDGEYDLSMIVDATKQSIDASDATTKDLQAVPVAMDEVTAPEDDHTLSREVEYKILEQDYEEEHTATQALNEEIQRAAAELAARMDTSATGEITTELPRNTQAQNDDVGNSGDTVGGDEPTADLHMAGNEVTVEMPANDNDVTAEMVVESGRVDTKKKKAS